MALNRFIVEYKAIHHQLPGDKVTCIHAKNEFAVMEVVLENKFELQKLNIFKDEVGET